MLGRMISPRKSLKIKSFLPFNFAITEVCVAIRSAEDRTRIGDIWFQLYPRSIKIKVLKVLIKKIYLNLYIQSKGIVLLYVHVLVQSETKCISTFLTSLFLVN